MTPRTFSTPILGDDDLGLEQDIELLNGFDVILGSSRFTPGFENPRQFPLTGRVFERIRASTDREFAEQVIEHALGLNEDSSQASPALAAQVSRRLRPMLDDGADPRPVAEITPRVLARLRTSQRNVLDLASKRPTFQWRDLAMAAAVLIVGLMTIFPAIQRSRAHRDLAYCSDNLRKVGMATIQASDIQNRPITLVNPKDPPVAGSWITVLNELGLLPDSEAHSLDCPGNGRDPASQKIPTMDALRTALEKAPATLRDLFNTDYAVAIGCGECHDGSDRERWPAHALPLMADRPAIDSQGVVLASGNSSNHNGLGQNVFYHDGHVAWTNQRQVFSDDDDIYLNRRRLPKPGVHLYDAVLAPTYYRYDGAESF